MSSPDSLTTFSRLRPRIFRRSDSLVTRQIAGEALLVPMRGKLAQLQQLFVLNPVGAFIWQQLDGIRDVEAIHRGLLETFEVTAEEARDDLVEYLRVLRDAKLIVEVGGDPTDAS